MPVEIERKFLVAHDGWRAVARSRQRLQQGYLSHGSGTTVRIRRAGSAAFLTVKGAGSVARAEFEYEIPVSDADTMLADLCRGPLIEKTRHEVCHAGMLWQVDEFHGFNEGLVVAEVELHAADQPVQLPDWVGREVTGDAAYRNSELARRPRGGRAGPGPMECAPAR